MRNTKLCEIEDFAGPELAGVLPERATDQRHWMAAVAFRSLADDGALPAAARVLAVGPDTAPVIALLGSRLGAVAAGEWADGDDAVASGPFDAVVCGPVEGLDSLAAVARAAAVLGRRLRVGGVLSLSTRFRLQGPPGGIGWPGRALVLSAEEIRRHVVEPSGLELVGELDEQVCEATLSAPRDLRDATSADGVCDGAAGDGPVVVRGGYVFTMAHLLLRKTKESEMERSARAATAAPTVPAPAPRVPVGGGWSEQVVSFQQGLVVLDDVLQRSLHQVNLVSDADFEVGRALDAVKEIRQAAGAGLSAAREHLAVRSEHEDGDPEAPPVASSEEPDVARCTVRLAEGLSYSVVVDERSADPITTTFLDGYCLFQHLVSLMLQLLEPGDPVLDIGAHLGTFTLAAAAAGSPVLAIEASPENARLLRASVASNRFLDVRVAGVAASDEPGTVQFCAIGPWGTVLNRAPSFLSVEVPAVTIDELVFELRFPRPRFVKMDVEGSEIRAMRGMTHLLSLDDAPPVLLESNGHTLALMGTTPTALLREVEGFGYTPYMVLGARLVPVTSADLQPRTEVDYLALKQAPPSLPGWTVAAPLTTDERLAMLVEDCSSQSEDCRAYIGRAIADGDAELLARPELAAALDRLAEDPIETVRAAVGWWTEGRRS